jgi:hypothetical protein
MAVSRNSTESEELRLERKRVGAGAWLRYPAAWPIHPLLFAAASVSALYVTNLRGMHFDDAVPALAAMVGAAFVLLLALGAAFRGIGPRAAVAASIILIGVIYGPDLFGRLDRLLGGALPASAELPLIAGIAAILVLIAARTRFDLTIPNALLNGIGLVLLLTPAWAALSYAWETGRLERSGAERPDQPAMTWGGAAAAPGAATAPDIYYFIFDRYGSEHVLARRFGVDNAPFLQSLRDRGFYVASDSHSNYPKTAPSLASTFHMDYLDFLVDDPLARRNEWHPLYDMLEEHRVGAVLKAHGYRIVQVGAWWGPTQSNSAADENHSFGFREFTWLYLRRTALPELASAITPGSAPARMAAWDNGQCRRVPLQFEQVKATSRRPEPTFTFVHVLLPHEPYVFDAEGRCLSPREVRARGKKAGYVEQLRYANRLIEQTLDVLLSQPEKPIIILQADEGPYPERYRASNRSWKLATPAEHDTKTGILNAFYFPDGDYEALYPDITSVNTFRLLFDKYFGTSYGPLPDRVFAFPDYSRIYDFFEVTDQVRRAGTPSLIRHLNELSSENQVRAR